MCFGAFNFDFGATITYCENTLSRHLPWDQPGAIRIMPTAKHGLKFLEMICTNVGRHKRHIYTLCIRFGSRALAVRAWVVKSVAFDTNFRWRCASGPCRLLARYQVVAWKYTHRISAWISCLGVWQKYILNVFAASYISSGDPFCGFTAEIWLATNDIQILFDHTNIHHMPTFKPSPHRPVTIKAHLVCNFIFNASENALDGKQKQISFAHNGYAYRRHILFFRSVRRQRFKLLGLNFFFLLNNKVEIITNLIFGFKINVLFECKLNSTRIPSNRKHIWVVLNGSEIT